MMVTAASLEPQAGESSGITKSRVGVSGVEGSEGVSEGVLEGGGSADSGDSALGVLVVGSTELSRISIDAFGVELSATVFVEEQEALNGNIPTMMIGSKQIIALVRQFFKFISSVTTMRACQRRPW